MISNKNNLQDAIGLFLQHDWEIKNQVGTSAMLEKQKLGMPFWAAVLIMLIFGLLGMFVVVLIKAIAGNDRVTLTLHDDGQVHAVTKKASLYSDSPNYDFQFIAQTANGMTWGVVFAIGIASACGNGILFSLING